MNYEKEIQELREKQNKEQNKQAKELIPQYKKEWLGRCFKYRNSYGGGESNWWLYAKITKIEGVNFMCSNGVEPNFYCFTFQKTSMNIIEIQPKQFKYRLNDWVEISKREFNTAYKKLLKELNGIPYLMKI